MRKDRYREKLSQINTSKLVYIFYIFFIKNRYGRDTITKIVDPIRKNS
jgi:hypothetical protein